MHSLPRDGWETVRRPYWWRREPHSSPVRRPATPGRDPHSQHNTNTRPQHQTSASLRAFQVRTEGRCFNCLASDHRAATCRDPIHCFTSHRSSHCARTCYYNRHNKFNLPPVRQQPVRCDSNRPPVRHQAARATPPLPPPPPTPARRSAMSRLGDPATRPEQADCLVQSTGDINADLKDWDSTATSHARCVAESQWTRGTSRGPSEKISSCTTVRLLFHDTFQKLFSSSSSIAAIALKRCRGQGYRH